MARLELTVWRHVPSGAHALNFGWLLKATGRWNRRGIYGCLYTSLTRAGAVAELEKQRTRSSPASATVSFATRDVVSIRVSVESVLDLMADVVIQNPVINSPFSEPVRHFEFGEHGMTGQILEGKRRESSYFVPSSEAAARSACAWHVR